MPSYLEKRYRTWYVVLDIPKALRPKFGDKRRFVQSLKTESRTVADRAKLQILAEWQRQLERARTGSEGLEDMVSHFRSQLDRIEQYDGPHEDMRAWWAGVLKGGVSPEATEAVGVAMGERFLLTEYQNRWASRGQVQEATKKAKLQKLKVLTKRFRYADEITTRSLLEWVENDLIGRQPLSSGTLRNYFTVWRDYWSYLERWHDLDQRNPFEQGILSDLQRLATRPTIRQVWEPEEYWDLLSGLDEGDPLHSLVQLAAYTGLRKTLLCSLKLEDIQEDRFTVHKSKYEIVSREFPIHSKLVPVFQRLRKQTKTELLFNIESGQEERFSHTIGERFRVHKVRKGYGAGKVLHSFRHTVASQLHKAQVPYYLVDLMLGWSVKGGSTGLRTYTKADFDQIRQAIEEVRY